MFSSLIMHIIRLRSSSRLGRKTRDMRLPFLYEHFFIIIIHLFSSPPPPRALSFGIIMLLTAFERQNIRVESSAAAN
ncbi:Hypothetical predicted protein [Cloeon dipterum]|uniref:Uncharacterized protein n=1 Tax=Cloeon dipterum TaxID=197152 RepID=A0A8S1CS72_9INSE|nr:Hypothetical predicted protein [Cloeon dipterum]